MAKADAGGLETPFSEPPALGEAVQIAPDLMWMRLPLPMALDHVNVYALRDPDGWTIVDTGIDTRKGRAIWEGILDGPLAGAPLRRVLVTHHHPDHIGLAGWMQKTHGAELLTTRTAWLFARMLQLDEQPVPSEEAIDYWRRAGMAAEEIEERKAERPFNFADTVAALPLGFTRLRDGQGICLGGRDWTVRFGQGHAPDHAVLFADDGSMVLAGDHYLPTISPNLGVYATEPEADPVAEWLESHRSLEPYLTDGQIALPGHGLPFRGLPARARALIANHIGALDRLEAHLSEPRTALECFQTIYKREIGRGEFILALVEAMAHCLALWHSGRATRTLRDDGAWLWQAKEV
ncbi:MAG: MBL fold metallo-hydrolase [Pseudomonadota bacterium]